MSGTIPQMVQREGSKLGKRPSKSGRRYDGYVDKHGYGPAQRRSSQQTAGSPAGYSPISPITAQSSRGFERR